MKKIVIGILVVIMIIASVVAIYLGTTSLPSDGITITGPSMSHETGSSSDINKGDIVVIDEVDGREDIVTYYEGKESNYMKYGNYGDVIVYKRDDPEETTPIIHRAILWLEFNDSATVADPNPNNGHFDIPELSLHDITGKVIIDNNFPSFTKNEDDGPLAIDLNMIYANMRSGPHSGFITKGDHNPINSIDQYQTSTPVQMERVKGKAVLYRENDVDRIYAGLYLSMIIVILCIVLIVVLLVKGRKNKSVALPGYPPGMPPQYG